MSVRRISILGALGLCAIVLAGCETTATNAPPITASLVRAAVRQQADAQVLAEGRSTFVNRCNQCHALPKVGKLSPARLRRVIASMSNRACLGPAEKDALVKYLFTVRSLDQ